MEKAVNSKRALTRRQFVSTTVAGVTLWGAAGKSAAAAVAAPPKFLTVNRLVINGRNYATEHGCADLDAGGKPAKVAIEFTLHAVSPVDITKLKINSQWNVQWFPGRTTYAWGPRCHYDAAFRRGVFRFQTLPLVPRASYQFTLYAGRILTGAAAEPAYTFYIRPYPSLIGVGTQALPCYSLPELPRNGFLEWPPEVYKAMSRDLPANTSLYFEIHPSAPFWPADRPVAPYLKIQLVEIESPPAASAWLQRPLKTQADLPSGRATLIYDGTQGGAKEGYHVDIQRSDRHYTVWVRKPAPGGPSYQNVPYLTAGRAYSLQFEVAHRPYLGVRYEATRFTVRREHAVRQLDITADFAGSHFIDWQGDWFNGHLLGADNTPSLQYAFWGQDYWLQKQMRDAYPDLWRTVVYCYLTSDGGGSPWFESANLYRDRSMRLVAKVSPISAQKAVVTLAHFTGAKYYHDPDCESDHLSDHPVVADDHESIFQPGDVVLLETGSGSPPGGKWMKAKVTAVNPTENQLLLAVGEPIWPIQPEAQAIDFAVVLGPPGAAPTRIKMARDLSATYLRLPNGRPFVNWGVLDFKFDFLVHAMEMRVAFQLANPFSYAGDCFTGAPTAAGWQLVSDCQYYVSRHVLTRYHANWDTFRYAIYSEGHWNGEQGVGYMALYDHLADGIMRAYEEVLDARGADYQKVIIGLAGVQLAWGMESTVRAVAAHAVPAPLEQIFPPTAPSDSSFGDKLPLQPVGSNPLYYFTPEERRRFYAAQWQYNACFLDAQGKPRVGPTDWNKRGRLTSRAVARLQAEGWPHSRWLLENTRFGKGSPFRQVSVEGYGLTAAQLADCNLLVKEMLAQLDANLRQACSDPYVRSYLHGHAFTPSANALFSWSVHGSNPLGRPFQGTGYWPSYFAEVLRRVVAETGRHPPGLYNHGLFTFDNFICPDRNNSGTNSDVATFTPDTGVKPRWTTLGGRRLESVPDQLGWVKLGPSRRIEVVQNQVAIAKDIRHLIRFIGMMTKRLAALPAHEGEGHVISGLMSKYCDRPGAVYETGNNPGDEHRGWVLLYDHAVGDLESQQRGAVPVILRVRNLPVHVQSARVTIYRLDRDHGSLFPVTERIAPDHGPVYSAQEIADLRAAAALAKDEEFAGQGQPRALTSGGLNLSLKLTTNCVLFVELDWGA